ncbi:hypothetical protein ACLOJK_037726 [Asimina triloba]
MGCLMTLYIDETFYKNGGGVGLMLEGLERIIAKYALRFELQATNSLAEYEALDLTRSNRF